MGTGAGVIPARLQRQVRRPNWGQPVSKAPERGGGSARGWKQASGCKARSAELHLEATLGLGLALGAAGGPPQGSGAPQPWPRPLLRLLACPSRRKTRAA